MHFISWKQIGKQTLVKKGKQIFIPEYLLYTPFNQSKKECIWVVVRSSCDYQDELITMPELVKELDKYRYFFWKYWYLFDTPTGKRVPC